MREAAGEVAGFEKVIGEGLQHVVEGVLAMRPVFQEISDIGAATLARRADQGRRHLQLVERLVPDLVQPLGLGHARADAGIDEVEEKQPGDPLWGGSCQRLHHRAADVMADDTGPVEAERVHQRQHVGCVLLGAERAVRLVAVAEAAQVGREQGVAVG